jgi:hypothetical protein
MAPSVAKLPLRISFTGTNGDRVFGHGLHPAIIVDGTVAERDTDPALEGIQLIHRLFGIENEDFMHRSRRKRTSCHIGSDIAVHLQTQSLEELLVSAVIISADSRLFFRCSSISIQLPISTVPGSNRIRPWC